MQHAAQQTTTFGSDQRASLNKLVNGYASEIAARRSRLLDDLSIYQGKLRDLAQLDPLDFSGLQCMYGSHIRQIEQLVAEFDDAGV
jgi:hypothetical protein